MHCRVRPCRKRHHSSHSRPRPPPIETEEEDREDYCRGGYHFVKVGDRYKDGQYLVIRKLGWGHFSTVWLVQDQRQVTSAAAATVSQKRKQRKFGLTITLNRTLKHFAMKVQKSAKHYREAALDEIQLSERVAKADPNALGAQYVTAIVDHFSIDGPNGNHVCMIFEVLGENLLELLRKSHHEGLRVRLVKQIAKQVLLGLDYLHRTCKIIHTDLKPENVMTYLDNAEEILRDASVPVMEPAEDQDEDDSRGRSRTRKSNRHVNLVASQPLSLDSKRDAEKKQGRKRSWST